MDVAAAVAEVVAVVVVAVVAATTSPPGVLVDSVADVSEVRVSLGLQPVDHCSLYCYYCY